MPRIGILIDRLTVGGVEKCAIEEVAALREMGVEATLLVLKRDRQLPVAFKDLLAPIPIVFLDDRLPRVLKLPWRVPGFYFFSFFHLIYAAALPARVRRHEWDVIVSHNSYTTFTASALSRFRRIPYVMFVWDPISEILQKAYPQGPIRWISPVLLRLARVLDRRLARGAKGLIAGSNSYLPLLRGLVDSSPHVTVIPPGCLPAGEPRQAAGDYVLAATSWKKGKQLEVLLHALARVKSARAVIAGRWLHQAYRERITELAGKLGVQSRIEICGELSERDLTAKVSEALCSVTLNAERGFGMPALEAAAQACAFVCPSTAGIAPYFKDGVEAFYFDEGDVDGLARIIERLNADPELALQAGKQAWAVARSSLTWKDHARALLDVTAAALAEHEVHVARGSVVGSAGNLRTAAVLLGIYMYARVQALLGQSPTVPAPEQAARGWRARLREALVMSPPARHVMRFKMRDGSRVRCRIVDSGGLLSVHVDRDYDVPNTHWDQLRTIVDVGAHVGSFTVWAALRAPNARCLAIEPNPETFALLQQNIRDNGLEDRVTAVNMAVAGQAGSGTLELLDHSLGTRLARNGGGGVSVAISTVQDLIAGARMSAVDLLKVDCEGMEYEVLAMMDPAQLRQIETLACEYHPQPGHDVTELDAVLSTAGFRLQRSDRPLGILWATR